ncbi:MAG: hypothetical protein MUD17_13770 [Gemmatimonadaceae bacterium]|nr:hypothetical protein [Gemmatimonadaceae bacterium]
MRTLGAVASAAAVSPSSATALFTRSAAAMSVMMNEPAGNSTPSAVNDCSATRIGTSFSR